MKKIELYLPIHTISEANWQEHWTKRHKRHVFQKKQIEIAFKNLDKIHLPVIVTITRIAPRELDEEDNLRMSVKAVKDYIADQLIPHLRMGRADNSKLIKWCYAQQKNKKPREYALKIEIISQDEPQL